VRGIINNNLVHLELSKLIFFLVSMVIVLFLRTLKHYTPLLNEIDRS